MGGDLRVFEVNTRTDLSAFADVRLAVKGAVGADLGVAVDAYVVIKPDGLGKMERDALFHQGLLASMEPFLFEESELCAIVDAHDFDGIFDDQGFDVTVLLDSEFDDIGEIEFTLGVVVVDTIEGIEQKVPCDEVDRSIAFFDQALGGVAVFVFLDLLDLALFVSDDPPVACGVVGFKSDHADGCVGLVFSAKHLPQCVFAQKRDVSAQK